MLLKENSSILIPVDFSKQSLIAIEQSYNLAKFLKAKMIIMHASPASNHEHEKELEEIVAKVIKESGQPAEYLNLKGDIYELIDKKAEELGCALIVIGLDTQVRFRSFLGGTNVSKFIKNAPCPVITMRSKDQRNSCSNILMPIDLSAESREKVGIAVQLAKYYKATIRIVSVFNPSDEKYENNLLPYLNQVKKFIKERGVDCTNRSIPSTNPAEAIVTYANNNDIDLIVLMNKKDTSFGELMGGASTSIKIVESSNVPVLSIHPMKRESISSGIH
jgi:nucleotide-binding universal stress UspA family protein